MRVFTQFVLLYTLIMLAAHLVSSWLLRRRWVRASALLRFEGAYYLALVAYVASARAHALIVPVAVLAIIHFGVWAMAEAKPSSVVVADGRTTRALIAVQIFDWAEALALVWIGWRILSLH